MRATRIHVAGQKARELLCRRPFGRLARQDRPLAEAILRTLHDRHVGITPELCADLVRLARGARRGEPIDGLWAPLVAHLGQTYYHTSQEATANRAADPATARHSGGQLPGTGTFYFISRVVEPLVARACQDLGETYLFGADDSEPGVPKGFPGRYAGYAGRLRDRLQQLLDGSSVPELFWCDRALTLTAISQPRAERGEEVLLFIHLSWLH